MGGIVGETLYERLADDLARAIKDGVLRPGERLPSVRRSGQARQLSVTTVLHAYRQLESRGLVESRPQSGYFVRDALDPEPALPPMQISKPPAASADVDVGRLVLATLKEIRTHGALPLGSPFPNPALFPTRRIFQYLNTVSRRCGGISSVMEDLPPGHPELIRQIAKRHLETGLAVNPDEIVVTAGATEAVNLCLQAVAKPGDVIAVESPTISTVLQAIERMGMRALELPTCPETGVDIASLRTALEQGTVAACIVMSNVQNPLGCSMPDQNKRDLVALANEHDLPLIEDAVCNEIYFGETPPTPLKAFDTRGLVLHCSSFSKWLTGSLRIGWALTGRYHLQVEKLKFINTLGTSALPQLAVAEYLKNERVEHHLRRVRRTLAQNAGIMSAMVQRFFPPNTKLSRPKGGYVLWVEVDPRWDTMALYRQALGSGITIGPGRLFSCSNQFGHFMRLNYSYPWSRKMDSGIIELGKMLAAAPRP